MASKQIKLSPEIIALCDDFGVRCSVGYAEGRKKKSLYYTTHGIDKDPAAQSVAKMAECAFAKWFGLTRDALDWTTEYPEGIERPDYDLVLPPNIKIDVKQTRLTAGHRRLIWQNTKVEKYHRTDFDVLVLVKVAAPHCEIMGWTSKQEFWDRHQMADGRNTPIDKGDWFMDQDDLWDVDALKSASSLAGLAIKYHKQFEFVAKGWPFAFNKEDSNA